MIAPRSQPAQKRSLFRSAPLLRLLPARCHPCPQEAMLQCHPRHPMADRKGLTPDEAEALAVSKQRKGKAKARGKASLPATLGKPAPQSPASFRQQWVKTAAGLSEEEQRKAVLQAIEVYKLLPPSSQYARHRLKAGGARRGARAGAAHRVCGRAGRCAAKRCGRRAHR